MVRGLDGGLADQRRMVLGDERKSGLADQPKLFLADKRR